MTSRLLFSSLFAAAALTSTALAQDWPQWGRDGSKNMSSPDAKNLPLSWNVGEKNDDGVVDMKTTKNVKLAIKLGSQTYGNPTIANGRIFVGTNNDSPRDKRFMGDHSLLYCFDEKTGDLLWQFTAPKIGSGKVGDWEYLGIASSPTIDGDFVYIVTNRFEVICLDVNGQANGNQGYQDEGKYWSGLNLNKPPLEVLKTDADIVWRFDMGEELGVFPHNVTSSAPLVVGDKLYCQTSNGVDWSHTNVPNPKAPQLICLDKKTGKLLGEEITGMGTRLLHGGWSSATYGKINDKGLVFFGGSDGILYAFDENPQPDPEDKDFKILKEVFRCDGNLPSYRFDKEGRPIKYVRPDGPSEFIATPVFYKNRVYIPIGQDPEHGEGLGRMLCIDATKTGDISKTGVIWDYTKINRSISTPSIYKDHVYVGDYAGWVHSLDAETGKLSWKHDTLAHIWGSVFTGDGKAYIGNEDGIVTVFVIDEMKKLAEEFGGEISTVKAGKVIEVTDKSGKKTKLSAERTAQLLHEVEMPGSVFSSPVYANGVLYIATGSHLYAIQETK